MKPEDYFLCSHESVTGCYPYPDESIPQLHIVFLQDPF